MFPRRVIPNSDENEEDSAPTNPFLDLLQALTTGGIAAMNAAMPPANALSSNPPPRSPMGRNPLTLGDSAHRSLLRELPRIRNEDDDDDGEEEAPRSAPSRGGFLSPSLRNREDRLGSSRAINALSSSTGTGGAGSRPREQFAVVTSGGNVLLIRIVESSGASTSTGENVEPPLSSLHRRLSRPLDVDGAHPHEPSVPDAPDVNLTQGPRFSFPASSLFGDPATTTTNPQELLIRAIVTNVLLNQSIFGGSGDGISNNPLLMEELNRLFTTIAGNQYSERPLEEEEMSAIDKVKLTPELVRSLQQVEREHCSICLDAYDEMMQSDVSVSPAIVCRLPCDHVFCWSCLQPWLERTSTCPNCRVSLGPVLKAEHPAPAWWTVGEAASVVTNKYSPSQPQSGRRSSQTLSEATEANRWRRLHHAMTRGTTAMPDTSSSESSSSSEDSENSRMNSHSSVPSHMTPEYVDVDASSNDSSEDEEEEHRLEALPTVRSGAAPSPPPDHPGRLTFRRLSISRRVPANTAMMRQLDAEASTPTVSTDSSAVAPSRMRSPRVTPSRRTAGEGVTRPTGSNLPSPEAMSLARRRPSQEKRQRQFDNGLRYSTQPRLSEREEPISPSSVSSQNRLFPRTGVRATTVAPPTEGRPRSMGGHAALNRTASLPRRRPIISAARGAVNGLSSTTNGASDRVPDSVFPRMRLVPMNRWRTALQEQHDVLNDSHRRGSSWRQLSLSEAHSPRAPPATSTPAQHATRLQARSTDTDSFNHTNGSSTVTSSAEVGNHERAAARQVPVRPTSHHHHSIVRRSSPAQPSRLPTPPGEVSPPAASRIHGTTAPATGIVSGGNRRGFRPILRPVEAVPSSTRCTQKSNPQHPPPR